jgi:tRNA-2-methylthio-N6-dimethylallyladenosine synthase
MSERKIIDKTIDESKQGEALVMELPTKANGKKLFLESYGCAMNFSDSEIVASILKDKGFSTTQNFNEADVIFVNTCAIREGAEQRVRQRLTDFKKAKKNNPDLIVGVLGCMAERLKSKLLEEEKLVDIVVGPDAYRSLPELIESAESGQKAVNVLLSREETYADISPVRLGSNGISAFVSITRGCDNMCSFCVVPFTRGRERSRSPETIVKEAKELFEQGYREVTLLGQNVDSYFWREAPSGSPKGEEEDKNNSSSHSGRKEEGLTFAQLLEMVALINPDLRVRFSTSHPKDMTDEVFHTINKYENICKYIHLPVQSGNTRILEMMNRGYTREWYMERISAIRKIIPDCAISTDIISGFCSETEEEHRDTISLMEWVQYDFAYMFAYNERPKTLAERKYKDDIPEEIKKRRLREIIDTQIKYSTKCTQKGVGKVHKVLVESISKKSEAEYQGRNSQNIVVVFPKGNAKPGDYVNVLATHSTSATLIGKVI